MARVKDGWIDGRSTTNAKKLYETYINKVLPQQYNKSIQNRNKNLKLKYLNRDCAIATKAQKKIRL